MLSESARRERIDAALDAIKDQEKPETLRIPWRDRYETLTVVSLPLDSVLLNPRSHRIKAHLESDDSSEDILADPYSQASQDRIAQTIRTLDGFDELAENLKGDQNEPGVITASGLLINANRRAVALRSINRDYIRVGVLPSDADNEEIDQLELRLQMKRDFRERYTFTNELLFVSDLINEHNYVAERVARELGWAASEDQRELRKGIEQVEQSLRMLSIIRGLQEQSAASIKLTFFDDKQQSLKELDDELQRFGDQDQHARDRIRDMRLAGILLGMGYKPLRQMDQDFVEDYLYERLAEDDFFGQAADDLTASESDTQTDPPGLELLQEDDDGRYDDPQREARPLLNFVLEAQQDRIRIPRTEFTVDRDSLPGLLTPIIDDAATNAHDDSRDQDNVDAPLKHAKAARQKVRRSAETLARVRDHPALDRGKLEYQIRKLAEEVDDLRDAL